MADDRTFTLIGRFDDQITPVLEGINKSIAGLKTTMATMTTKRGGGFGDVTQSIGKLVSAQIHLKEAIEGVASAAKEATGELKNYRQEVGKVASAHYHIQKSGTGAGKTQTKFWEGANRELDEYKRKMESLQRQTRINPSRALTQPTGRRSSSAPVYMPPGGGGPPRPPRGGGGGGSPAGGMGAHMAEFGFAYTLGNAISQPIQNAIVSGFQIGIGMMTKPFQYFVSNFGERMQDEMSDLKAAGGFFSISREQKERGEKGFVDTFRDAVNFTQENNRVMDKMAATLPGVTEDYVEVSKRISDSVARLVTNDSQKAAVYAESIRKAEPQYFKDMKQPITSMTGEAQQKASIQAILADLTKSTVLAGQGGRAGVGGARGAYGLPQLTERMLSEDEVSLGQFQRYAAIFSDPMIMSALEKEIPNINKSAKNTVERAKAIKALFERVLPPELIAAYRRTMSGITEGFRTALVGRESGLFGLGRPLEILVKEFDEFGNVIKDEAGKIKQQRIGLYNFIRDMAANLGQVFQPIVENITLMYDPLTEIGKKLVKAREFTYKLLESFNFYLGGFEKLGFEGSEANLRASLAAIANLLRYVGAIDTKGFESYINQLKGKNVDFGAMMSGMLDKLLNSNAAFEFGKTIGDVVGTVISEVAKATGFISGRLKSSNQLFEGLKKGFNDAGGVKAFQNIFKDVFSSILKVLWEIFKPGGLMPFEGYMLIAAMTILPAAVQGLGMLFAEKMLAGILGIRDKALGLVAGSFDNFDVSRQTFLLDRTRAVRGFAPGGQGSGVKNAFATTADDLAKTAKGEDFIPLSKAKVTTISQDIAEMTSKILPEEIVRSEQFPNLALGTYKPVEIGGKFKAPEIPKPLKGGPKGMKKWGEELAKGFSKAAKKTKNFFGNWMGEGGMGTRLGAGGMTGLKNPLGMMNKFGIALVGLTGIISGVSRFFETGDIWKAIGATAGPIAGSIIGFAIAGPLGSFIGGWIGEQQWVTDTLGQAAQQLSQNLTGAFDELGGLLMDVAAALNPLFGVSSELDKFHSLIVLLKIALTPFVAAFMLLEQSIRGLRMILKQAQIEFFENGFFGLGKDQKKAQQLRKELLELNKEAFAQLERDKAWFQTYKEGDKAVLGGQNVTRKGGKWVNAQGNEVTGSEQKPESDSPTMNSRNYTVGGVTYDWKTGKPVSGSSPSSGEKTKTTTPVPKEIASTAQNTTEINNRAATQVTQGASVQKSSDEVKKNTATANVTLGNIRSGIIAISNKLTGIQTAILGDLNNIQAGVSRISSLLSSGQLKVQFSFPGMMPGGPMGGAPGGLGAAQQLAGQYGLQLTSWFRPGDKGMHGVGRAMDFSNGVDTPQQMAFARAMIAQYGSSLKELIYTPLGFGIKDGTPVPLSYWGARTNAMHYNHVHVAFAEGADQGRMFTNPEAAGGWEQSMVPGSVKVASITGNSAEGFGATINGGINVTLNAGAVQDPDQLAYMVAERIQEAVGDAVNANILV